MSDDKPQNETVWASNRLSLSTFYTSTQGFPFRLYVPCDFDFKRTEWPPKKRGRPRKEKGNE
jgi:hypothetical protein